MVKGKITRDLMKTIKKIKGFGYKSMKSTIALYSILALVVLNLFIFIGNEDNESLFLFLVISAIVYTKTSNMIPVLLIPLVVVNSLIYLRKLFMKREGLESGVKLPAFNKWFDEYMSDSEMPKDDDAEGLEFYENMIKPVADIENKNEPASLDDVEKIMKLYTSLNEMSEKKSDSVSTYIKKIVDKFKDEFTEPEESQDDEKKTNTEDDKEGFAILEGYEDEEDSDEDDFD